MKYTLFTRPALSALLSATMLLLVMATDLLDSEQASIDSSRLYRTKLITSIPVVHALLGPSSIILMLGIATAEKTDALIQNRCKSSDLRAMGSIQDQHYTIFHNRVQNVSLSSFYFADSTGSVCNPDEYIYSFKVYSDAQLTIEVLSSEIFHQGSTLEWSFDDPARAGTYYVQVTNTLAPDHVSDTRFQLIVSTEYRSLNSECNGANQNPTVTITIPTPPQYYQQGKAGVTQFEKFSVTNSTMCNDDDVVYSIASVVPTTSIFSIDSEDEKIYWTAPPDCSTVYNVTLQGLIGNGQGDGAIKNHGATQVITYQCFTCQTTTEQISITATTPATQTYFIGPTPASTTIKFTHNSLYCIDPNFVYSMIITKPAGVSSTTWITLNNSTVTWSTANFANVGTYTIALTATLPTQSKTVTFTLVVMATCAQSQDRPTLIVSSPPPNQRLYQNQSGTYQLSAFSISPSVTYCQPTDIAYSLSSNGSIVTFNSTTRLISWAASPTCANYTVMVTGTVTTSATPTTYTAQTSFQLQCFFTCATTPETITIAGVAPAAQTYYLGAATASVTLAQFTENSIYCSQEDFAYTMAVTGPSGGSTIWISLNGLTVSWATQLFANVGLYTVSIKGSLPTSSNAVSFELDVKANCTTSIDQPKIIATQTLDQLYTVNTSGQVVATEFIISPQVVYCRNTDIVYSLTAPNFVTFNPDTMVISWAQHSVCQSYVLQLSGTITTQATPSLYTATRTIQLNCYTCQTTLEQINITAPSPQSASYQINQAQGSLSLTPFTEDSIYCKSSDFVYTMAVTGPANTDWITMQGLTILWQTDQQANAGLYVITVTGTLPNNSSKSVQVQLQVDVQNCAGSSDKPNIVPQIANDLTYFIGLSGSTSITKFIILPEVAICAQNDIVYSFATRPSNSFVAFNATSLVMTWTTPPVCQSYSVNVTGAITTAAGTFSASQTFMLSCYTCATSPETIAISASAPLTQYYALGTPAGSVTFSAFTEDSAYCQSSDFTYAVAVTAPEGVTDSTWITLSGQTIAWSTSRFSDVGAYTISITGTLPTEPKQTKTVSFVLNVGITCATSNDQPQLAFKTLSDQSYFAGVSSSLTPDQFEIKNSTTCQQSDIVYSLSVSPAQDSITFNPVTRQINWTIPTCQQITLILIGTVTSSVSTYEAEQTILLSCYTCATSQESISIQGTPPAPQNYSYGDLPSQIQIEFTFTSKYCLQSDLAYKMSVVPPSPITDTTWISFDKNIVKWSTGPNTYDGKYLITLTATLPNLEEGSVQFVLNVGPKCQQFTVNQPTPLQMYVVGQSGSVTPSAFQGSDLCPDIVYTLSPPDLVAFDPATRQITWKLQTCQTYQLQMTGRTANFAATDTFELKCYTCQQTPETIKITAIAPTQQSYSIGDPQSSVTFLPFNLNSSYCQQSDFTYSLQTSLSWIKLQGTQISWQSSQFFEGTVAIKVIGTLPNNQQQSFSFNLKVTVRCQMSYDFPQIIVAAPNNDVRIQPGVSGSFTVNAFSLAPGAQHCTKKDIQYSVSVTPSTTNIQFNPSSLQLTWKQYSRCQNYTVTIVGAIQTQAAKAENQNTIRLNCYASCFFDTSQPILMQSIQPGQIVYTAGDGDSHVQIQQFTQDSVTCQQSDITYSMSSNSTDITFNAETLIIHWAQSIPLGLYKITVTGTIKTALQWFTHSVTFNLNVIAVDRVQHNIVIYDKKTPVVVANHSVTTVTTNFKAKTMRVLQDEETVEGRIWYLNGDRKVDKDTAEIVIWMTSGKAANIYIYSGFDFLNRSQVIQRNSSLVLGAPVRVMVGKGAIVVIQSTNAQIDGFASFSFYIEGDKQKWFEAPFIDQPSISYYLFLASIPIAIFTMLCGLPCLLTFYFCGCNMLNCLFCCCKRKNTNRLMPKQIKFQRSQSISPTRKNKTGNRYVDDWTTSVKATGIKDWDQVDNDSAISVIAGMSRIKIEEDWDQCKQETNRKLNSSMHSSYQNNVAYLVPPSSFPDHRQSINSSTQLKEVPLPEVFDDLLSRSECSIKFSEAAIEAPPLNPTPTPCSRIIEESSRAPPILLAPVPDLDQMDVPEWVPKSGRSNGPFTFASSPKQIKKKNQAVKHEAKSCNNVLATDLSGNKIPIPFIKPF